MGFTIEQYAKLRPTLWHLTHLDNLASLRRMPILFPAEHFLAATPVVSRRDCIVTPDGVVLRNQALLHENCIAFVEGYSFSLFIRDLNRRVFFWSGWPDRPSGSGRRAIEHYKKTDVLIRVPFLDVSEFHTPYFARCNSGAPRMQHGKTVSRGPRTFSVATECDFPAAEVVEVTFPDKVVLPESAEVAVPSATCWQCLQLPAGVCRA